MRLACSSAIESLGLRGHLHASMFDIRARCACNASEPQGKQGPGFPHVSLIRQNKNLHCLKWLKVNALIDTSYDKLALSPDG